MHQQQDSIVSESVVTATAADTMVQRPTRPQTPYQVLRMLPKDATPAQQDSAIQAWFQPGEVHYSDRPDTLHLPGHDAGVNRMNITLPQYYKETFFAKDSLLHPELAGGRFGVAGDPVPYTVRNDDAITAMLLFCFVMTVVAYAYSREFILRQLKDFFYVSHSEHSSSEGHSNRFQLFLSLLTCLLLGITYYLFVNHFVTETFILDTPYVIIGIFAGVFAAYYIGKAFVYRMVNSVFFDGKKCGQWTRAFTFITAFEGALLFPVVVLQVYFGLPMQNVVYYLVFVLILTKLLTFYKCWLIFFKQISFFLQIILYLCALEIIPLLSLGGVLVLITDHLKVNF